MTVNGRVDDSVTDITKAIGATTALTALDIIL